MVVIFEDRSNLCRWLLTSCSYFPTNALQITTDLLSSISRLLLKGKARKAEIELLEFRLLKEFGVEPQKEARGKKVKKVPPKRKGAKKCNEDEDEDFGKKFGAGKSGATRGFTIANE